MWNMAQQLSWLRSGVFSLFPAKPLQDLFWRCLQCRYKSGLHSCRYDVSVAIQHFARNCDCTCLRGASAWCQVNVASSCWPCERGYFCAQGPAWKDGLEGVASLWISCSDCFHLSVFQKTWHQEGASLCRSYFFWMLATQICMQERTEWQTLNPLHGPFLCHVAHSACGWPMSLCEIVSDDVGSDSSLVAMLFSLASK